MTPKNSFVSAVFHLLTSILFALSIIIAGSSAACGQEDANPEDKAARSSLDELPEEKKLELQKTIQRITYPRRREFDLAQDIALVNEYAPLESPGIYEAHFCLAKFELARRNNQSNFRGRIDLDYVKQHLDHCKTLRADDPKIDLLLSDYYTIASNRVAYSRSPEYDLATSIELKRKAFKHNVGKLRSLAYALENEGMLDEAFKDEVVQRLTKEIESGVFTENLHAAIYALEVPLGRIEASKKLYDGFLKNFESKPKSRAAQGLLLKTKFTISQQRIRVMIGEYERSGDYRQLLESHEKLADDDPLAANIAGSGANFILVPDSIKVAMAKMILAGESVDRAKAIFDPFEIEGDVANRNRPKNRRTKVKFRHVPAEARTLITDAYFEKGDFETALLWTGPGYGKLESIELAKWGLTVWKSQAKDSTKLALTTIDSHLKENLKHNLNHYGSAKDIKEDDLLFKAHGLLLARAERFTEAIDPLKYYLSKYPDDKESKQQFEKCIERIRRELEDLNSVAKEDQE